MVKMPLLTWRPSYNQFDFGGAAANFIKFTADYLHQDSRMKAFGVAYTDEIMGDLTMNSGIYSFEAGKGGQITLNFRFPKGTDEKDIEAGLKKAAQPLDIEVKRSGKLQVPHYVSPEDPLVKTLLNVYQEQTGEPAESKVVGGGTYGRLMERGSLLAQCSQVYLIRCTKQTNLCRSMIW